MQTDFEFFINGDIHRSEGASVNCSLREYLMRSGKGRLSRDVCPVLLGVFDARQKPALRIVHSCRIALPMLAEREIWTVDAIGSQGEPIDSLQQALSINQQISCQCGNATESMFFSGNSANTIKSDYGCQHPNSTGWLSFPTALNALLQEQKDLDEGADHQIESPISESGIERSFSYVDASGGLFFRPASLREALRLLQSYPAASILAGDTVYPGAADVIDSQTAPVVVSIDSIVQLGQVSLHEGRWHVGGAVSLRAFTDAMSSRFPLIERMTKAMGSLPLKNLLTISGGLMDELSNPELLTVLLALDAQVIISGLSGERRLMLKEAFQGVLSSALKQGEIVSGVLLESPMDREEQSSGHHLTGFYQIVRRHSTDRAMVCAAFSVMVDENERVVRARLCYGGIGERVKRAYEAEELLRGGLWGGKLASKVTRCLNAEFSGQQVGGDSVYRSAMAGSLWRKFFAENETPGELFRFPQGLDNGVPNDSKPNGNC